MVVCSTRQEARLDNLVLGPRLYYLIIYADLAFLVGF